MPDKMIVAFPFEGFYETFHSDRMFDEISQVLFGKYWEETKNDDEIERAYDYARENKAEIAYCRQYVSSVCKMYGLTTVEFDEMTSPKEYNFRTDRIFAAMDKDEMKRVLSGLDMEKLAKRVKEKHSSREGFWSWVESDLAKWNLEELDHNQAETVLEEYFDEKYKEMGFRDSWHHDLATEHPEEFLI